MFLLSSCMNNSSNLIETSELTNTQTTTHEYTDHRTVFSDQVIFDVFVDIINIDDMNPVVTVYVEIQTKMNIQQTLSTSSFGEEAIIEIRIVSITDEQVKLYSELYDVIINHEELDVNLNIDQKLSRDLKFARLPFHEVHQELISPIGTYKIQVGLHASEISWIDTGILLTVT